MSNFFWLIIIFRLATSLRYVQLMMSPKRFDYSSIRQYRYGNRPNYRTGDDIVTLPKITGTVIDHMTIPVMLSNNYRYSNWQNYRTGNAIVTLCIITGMVIGQVTIPVMLS
jgi:hypothetical protein